MMRKIRNYLCQIILFALMALIISLFLLTQRRTAKTLDIPFANLKISDTITFGDGMMINMPDMADARLLVWYDADSSCFRWNLNKPCYIKLNFKNPNIYSLSQIGGMSNGRHFISIQQIQKLFADQNITKGYASVGHIFNCLYPGESNESIQSLIAVKENAFVLLDDSTLKVVDTQQQPLLAKLNGKFTGLPVTIEFFKILKKEYVQANIKDQLHNADMAYFSKPVSVYTGWGASETYLDVRNDKDSAHIVIYFDKMYRAILPQKNIEKALSKSDTTFTSVRQYSQVTPFDDYLYVPDFLNGLDPILLQVNTEGEPKVLAEKFQVIYQNAKSPIIPMLLLLLVVFCMTTVLFFFTKSNTWDPDFKWQDLTGQWQIYFCVLMTFLLILSLARVFIGYHLSLTPPYYPSLYHSAIMISFFVLTMVPYFWITHYYHFSSRKGEELTSKSGDRFVLYQLGFFVFLFLGIFIFRVCSGYSIVAPLGNMKAAWFFNFFQKLLLTSDYSVVIAFASGFLIIGVNIIIAIIQLACSKTIHKYTSTVYVLALISLAVGILGMSSSRNSYSLLVLLLFFILSALSINDFTQLFKGRTLPRVLSITQRMTNINNVLIIKVGLLLLVTCIVALISQDAGFIINIILIVPIAIWLLKILFSDTYPDANKSIWKRLHLDWIGLIVIYFLAVVVVINVFAWKNDLSDRASARFKTFTDFERVREEGTRQSESIAEFFAVLSQYVWPSEAYDPFEPYHSSIASNSDPVVVNDVSVPAALIYPLGNVGWWLVPLLSVILWVFIMYYVIRFNIHPAVNDERYAPFINSTRLVRILSMLVLCGSGLYLMASYYNIVPFTGRLIYGTGQDSVAEVLETVMLFSVMGLVFIPEHRQGEAVGNENQ